MKKKDLQPFFGIAKQDRVQHEIARCLHQKLLCTSVARVFRKSEDEQAKQQLCGSRLFTA